MEDIILILIGISLLFFIFLAVKEFFNKKLKKEFCVICLSVILTWLVLLILYWVNLFNDKVIIALLMGHTSLGVFYLAEKKVKKKFKLFRLPFLLSLIFIAYSLLEGFIITNALFLIILWIFFIFIYVFKNNKKVGDFGKKIIECCKKW